MKEKFKVILALPVLASLIYGVPWVTSQLFNSHTNIGLLAIFLLYGVLILLYPIIVNIIKTFIEYIKILMKGKK